MNTLPGIASECCPPSCDEASTVQIPGPQGIAGADGADGVDGDDAWTLFTSNFTIPAEGASTVAAVGNTNFITINEILYAAKSDGSVVAYLQAVAIGGTTAVTLKNIEDTASGAYLINSAPGSILPTGSKLSPAGIQGPATNPSGAAGGDLKGTYPNPKISVANTKGSSLWGDGTDTVAVPAGTNGHMLAYDSTDAEGIKSFKALPVTGDTDLADNRVLRADGATGLPAPAQPSKVTITDNGAVRADGSGGNARGTDAVDLQVTRGGATQVASGTNSTIGGGQSNTASNTNSTVAGGTTNAATGSAASIGGGNGNTASASVSSVNGGDSNTASGTASTVAGGDSNVASNTASTVGGGFINLASGQFSTIAGGNDGTASAANSTVGGGFSNEASGASALVAGGSANLASADYSSVCGGLDAVADKYGQVSRANGRFASNGDAQVIELLWRNATANATPTELFLDGISVQATIADGVSWIFRILLVARRSTGTTSIYESIGQITRVGATTAVAAVTTTELNDGIGLPAAPVTVDADNVNEALRITVTGVAAQDIRWVASARIVQVIYP